MQIYILLIAVVVLVILEVFLVWRKKGRFSKSDLSLIRGEWDSIRGKIVREPKYALIEADKLLDYVLKKSGYCGSLSEKLIKAEKIFHHIDDIWKMHKMRNRAAHEVGFTVHEEQVRRALSVYKQALWDLGIKL